jgi:RNA polymerase sigma-70 factor (ECF subfamily)
MIEPLSTASRPPAAPRRLTKCRARELRRGTEGGEAGCIARRMPADCGDMTLVEKRGPAALCMTWTDEELVARSIGGDAESFNQLILRWERPIYALAYRTIGREEDARDICQETFLRAFRALPGFRGQAKFSSWLYRIALNLCRDWIRRERRTPVVQASEDIDLIELAAAAEPSESIEDLVARKDLTRLVERAMAKLPEEQRTAIVLKEYHGLTFQEIADLVGCPLSTVKTRLYQGLTVLRREMAVTAGRRVG